MSASPAERPITLLVAALGGEGGGVLTDWIVRAAEAQGLVVQSTSIPGVAQRTGATTYYIELFPIPESELGGRRPILSLYPSVGGVDLMVASEIIEAGRAIQAGYVTPDRTTLIASTHRIYAIGERAGMADARFDQMRIREAASRRAAQTRLGDYLAVAQEEGTVLNAVLLGLIAGSGVLPLAEAAYADAIREEGKAVESNLRGFEAGLAIAKGTRQAPDRPAERRGRRPTAADVEARVRSDFPEPAHDMLLEGVRRLVEYQDASYAMHYLDRLAPVRDAERTAGGDGALTRETGRWLALWMSYDDIIRVAQLKTRPDRYARILAEVRAAPGDPVAVTEFFKPGVDELASILPPAIGRRLVALAERRGWRDKAYLGLHIKTTTVWGFFRVWLLARLRPWRRRTWRFAEEAKAIDGWLGLVVQAAGLGPAFALEVAGMGRLIKGYGDTYRRGMASFLRIRDLVVAPALAGEIPAARAADAVANARAAALSDATGARLEQAIASISQAALPSAAE